jgi:hypothetical protein
MINTPSSPIGNEEPVSLLSFIADVGPVLLASLSFSMLLFLAWYFVVERRNQLKKRESWLLNNENLIHQYKNLQYLLENFGQEISSCANCKNDQMQLCNYQKEELLVVRCGSCKRNYTFTKQYNELIPLILKQLEGVIKLLNTVVVHRDNSLGEFLMDQLALDPKKITSDVRPLELIHFKTYLEEQNTPIMEIFINEWQVVPSKTTRLLAS